MKIHRTCSVSGLFSSLSFLLLAGCGASGDGYQAVSGVVTFQGVRVQDGSIQFISDGEQSVVCGGAMIRDGEYRLPREHGLKPGRYRVRISSAERLENPDKEQAAMNPFLSRERIPAQFNTNSELRIEVRTDAPARFDFDLP